MIWRITDTPEPDEFDKKAEKEEGMVLADASDNPAAKLLGVEPTKGLSRQTRQWEKNGEKDAGPPAAPATNYKPGKDDDVTKEFKERTGPAKREDGIKKLMELRGVSRDQAEKMIPAR